MTLRSGAVFRGMPVALEEEQVALDLPGDGCVWVLMSEIAAVTAREQLVRTTMYIISPALAQIDTDPPMLTRSPR